MDKERIRAFSDKIFADLAGSTVAGLSYVGIETGLFQTMAGKGHLRPEEVVQQSGLQSRYVEEWLKGMVCAGYLEYEPDAETYMLPDEHAYLLASDGTDHFLGGLFGVIPFILGVAPNVAEAFQHGGGVPFEEYGEEFVSVVDRMNRGAYEHRLASYWLQALPKVVKRLESGGHALDVGCGAGSVSLALAKAFPNANFLGLDLDVESVQQAKTNAQAAGLGDRVQFVAQGLGELEDGPAFDLITACDCVHDFAEPISTLRDIRSRLKSNGTLFVVEPRVADRLEDNLNPIATMFYGFSVFHCMTQSLAIGGQGLGACMGPARTELLMEEAGFGRFEQLDIKSSTSLFYAVYP